MNVSESRSRRPERAAGLERRPLGAGYMVVGAEGEVVCEINETAAALWELCDGDTTVAEIVDAVCQMFPTDRPTVTADVEQALAEMVRCGAVEWRG